MMRTSLSLLWLIATFAEGRKSGDVFEVLLRAPEAERESVLNRWIESGTPLVEGLR